MGLCWPFWDFSALVFWVGIDACSSVGDFTLPFVPLGPARVASPPSWPCCSLCAALLACFSALAFFFCSAAESFDSSILASCAQDFCVAQGFNFLSERSNGFNFRMATAIDNVLLCDPNCAFKLIQVQGSISVLHFLRSLGFEVYADV